MRRRPILAALLAILWIVTSVPEVFAGPIKLNGNGNAGNGNGNGNAGNGNGNGNGNANGGNGNAGNGNVNAGNGNGNGNAGNGNGNGNGAGNSQPPAPIGPSCGASCVNLTTAGSSGTANGAIFQQISPQPTGTGFIQPFVRLQSQGVALTTEGYNTSFRPFEFDEKNPLNFTHDLLLANVPILSINGVAYREFKLDINESRGGNRELLSLDQIQIYQSGTGMRTGYPGLGTLIWDLDAGLDRWIFMNYELNHGSGSGDMAMYVPNSLFNNLSYVYLYSQFGTNYSVDAGFEEWWVGQAAAVPEPSSLALLGAAVAGLGLIRRRRKS